MKLHKILLLIPLAFKYISIVHKGLKVLTATLSEFLQDIDLTTLTAEMS